MPCNTALTNEINPAQSTHPGPYGPMNFLLMCNVAFWVHESGNTTGERTILHF